MMLCPRPRFVNAARLGAPEKQSRFSRAERTDSKATTTEIDSHLRKSRRRQSRERRRRRHRHKRASHVPHSVHPPILNLKRKEYSAWAKYPPNFRKSAVLQLVRTQVMKH
jgi:hypothetical protein